MPKISTSLPRSWVEVTRRVWDYAYNGVANKCAPFISAMNGESVLTLTYSATQPAAQTIPTGAYALIGTDGTAANKVQVPNGLTIPSGQSLTIAPGASFVNSGNSSTSAADALTAHAGGGQGSALALTAVINRVTIVATAGDSVSLPSTTTLAAGAGLTCVIINDAVNSLQVYGAGTDTVNDVATATGIPLLGKSMAEFRCAVTGKWYSVNQWNSQVVNLSATSILDSGGNVAFAISATASAVNGLTETNSALGNPVTLATSGTDTNIGLTLNAKGTGAVTIAPVAAGGTVLIGGTAQSGSITVGSSSAAGTVAVAAGAGAPTVAIANSSTAGATVTVAGAATAAAATDTVNIATGNAAATGAKNVNIATGTPGTSGNNNVSIGGGVTTDLTFNAVVRSYQAVNYQGTESGANNALVAALVDASGANVTVAAGLIIWLKLAHSLQAGANTLNLNGAGTSAIKKASNPATDLSVTAVSGSILMMIYDGTVYQVQGQ